MAKTIFNMADGILTPCTQCGTITTLISSGDCTLQCGTITTLISPGDCTLQCGMWLLNHDSEFTKWQHPAMRYVAVE